MVDTMKMFTQLFFFTFLASSQGLMILNKTKGHHGEVDELLTLIITCCYRDPYSIVVYDNPEYNYNLARILQSTERVSIVLANPLKTFHRPDYRYQLTIRQYSHKANFIFISNESVEGFDDLLTILQSTPWWNHMAVFVIVDQSSHSCNDNSIVLKKLWQRDVLTSFFLCYNQAGQLVIFTVNPFTNYAPAPWKSVDAKGIQKSDHSCTLYYQIYHSKNSKICQNFNFDRTKYFKGHNKLKALVCISDEKLYSTLNNFNKSVIIKEQTYPVDLIQEILDLKFSIQYHFVNLSDISMGNNYRETIPADFFLCPSPIWEFKPKVFSFYPVIQLESVIVSRYRGTMSPLENMGNFYGFFIIFMTIMLLLITYCVIIISQNQQTYSFAFFEILRLLKNSGIFSNISTIKLRIFFAMIFFYFLVLHATFSSHLSSFVTQRRERKVPQSLDDLKRSSIKKVYVPFTISVDHVDPEIRKKVVITNDINCKVLFDVRGHNHACITFKNIIINYLVRKKLRISRNDVIRSHFCYSSRLTWPLNQRINDFIMRLEQSHLISFLLNSYEKSVRNNILRSNVRISKKYRPIKLDDLLFVFYFLGIGMFIATFNFLIEILRNKMKYPRIK